MIWNFFRHKSTHKVQSRAHKTLETDTKENWMLYATPLQVAFVYNALKELIQSRLGVWVKLLQNIRDAFMKSHTLQRII